MNLRRFGIWLAVFAGVAQAITIFATGVEGGTTAASIPYTANMIMVVVGSALAVGSTRGEAFTRSDRVGIAIVIVGLCAAIVPAVHDTWFL